MTKSGQKIVKMIGDGNCYYRGISYQLFGTQEEHPTIRSVIHRMENLNKDIFSPYLISGVNKPTMEEQIEHVWESRTWATHVEVLATATVFQVPIFYCTKDLNDGFKWKVVKPICTSEKQKLSIPALPDVDPNITLLMPDHFEFLYFENHHYDVVVSSANGKVCADHPVLAGVNDQSCVIELSS